MKIKYILAGNHQYFLSWCTSNDISPISKYVRYTSEPIVLRGLSLDSAEFHYHYTWRSHPDWEELKELVEIAQFKTSKMEVLKVESIDGFFTWTFWKRALERAIKTVAQTLLVAVPMDVTNTINLDWRGTIGMALGAGVISILMSAVGSRVSGNSADPSWIPTNKEDKNVDKEANTYVK